jgi:hypothetical protein
VFCRYIQAKAKAASTSKHIEEQAMDINQTNHDKNDSNNGLFPRKRRLSDEEEDTTAVSKKAKLSSTDSSSSVYNRIVQYSMRIMRFFRFDSFLSNSSNSTNDSNNSTAVSTKQDDQDQNTIEDNTTTIKDKDKNSNDTMITFRDKVFIEDIIFHIHSYYN